MTSEKLTELNKLHFKLECIVKHRTHFMMHPATQDRSAVIYLTGGGNYDPSPWTWKRLRGILTEDIDQRAAEAKAEFEVAEPCNEEHCLAQLAAARDEIARLEAVLETFENLYG